MMMSDDAQQLDHQRFKTQQSASNIVAPRIAAIGISSPSNVGMLFRIADAVGVQEILLINGEVTPSNRKVRQVARHTVRHIPHQELTLAAFIAAQAQFAPLVALEITTTSQDIYATALPQQMTLIIGNEQHGIPEEILGICKFAVHIPMFGANSSMNVATATGIALYEWHRQHRTSATPTHSATDSESPR